MEKKLRCKMGKLISWGYPLQTDSELIVQHNLVLLGLIVGS